MTTTAWRRADHLARLKQTDAVDTLVVGGGVIGAGSVLDLAARGANVALVEQGDFAQGTSSRSTKLFHGGIRYLPHFEFVLVSEGLREQKVLNHIADFLYNPLEFVIPTYEQYGLADAPRWASRGWIAPWALRAGLTLYDMLGGFNRPGDRHRGITTESLAEILPDLRTDGLKGGVVYSDAQTDDARLVISLLKTAVRKFDATVTSGVKVTSIRPEAHHFVAELLDTHTGERFSVEAKTVLAATGAFDLPGIEGPARPVKLVASKGTHLIVNGADLPLRGRALVLPTTDDGRVLFIVPWLNHAMIGTTDTPYAGDPTHPTASEEDSSYLIRHVRRYLDIPEFEPISSFAGLRALADPGGESTAKASREHVIAQPAPGLVQVAGGKLTTYRLIAEEAVDEIAENLSLETPCSTESIKLVGADCAYPSLRHQLADAGMAESAIDASISRYGTEVLALARLIETRPELAETFGDGRTCGADVVYTARHEAATRISDITLRRTHLAWFTKDHARSDAPAIGRLLAEELDWSEDELAIQLEAHETELLAEGL